MLHLPRGFTPSLQLKTFPDSDGVHGVALEKQDCNRNSTPQPLANAPAAPLRDDVVGPRARGGGGRGPIGVPTLDGD